MSLDNSPIFIIHYYRHNNDYYCVSSLTDISLLKFLANSYYWIKSVPLLCFITIFEGYVWALQLTYLKWKKLAIFSVPYKAAQNADYTHLDPLLEKPRRSDTEVP